MKTNLKNRTSITDSLRNFEKDCKHFTQELKQNYPGIKILPDDEISFGVGNNLTDQVKGSNYDIQMYSSVEYCGLNTGILLTLDLSGKIHLNATVIMIDGSRFHLLEFTNGHKFEELKDYYKIFTNEGKTIGITMSQEKFEQVLPKIIEFLTMKTTVEV